VYCKLNYFGILCNTSFKEHLPEDGHLLVAETYVFVIQYNKFTYLYMHRIPFDFSIKECMQHFVESERENSQELKSVDPPLN